MIGAVSCLSLVGFRAHAGTVDCDSATYWDVECDGVYCGYASGDRVIWNGAEYECRAWPQGGWCVHQAYEPGTTVGNDAWTKIGDCQEEVVAPLPFEFRQVPVVRCSGDACSLAAVTVRANMAPDDPRVLALEEEIEQDHLNAAINSRLSQSAELAIETDKCRAMADALIQGGAGSTQIEVHLYLPEVPFDFRRFQKSPAQAGYADRDAQVAAYENEYASQVSGFQGAAVSAVTNGGGAVLSLGKFESAVDAMIPAQAMSTLLANSGIEAASCGNEAAQSHANGLGIRRALGIPDEAYRVPSDANLDHSASQGRRIGSPDSPVRIGIIEAEEQNLNVGHYAFMDWPNGPSRIVKTRKCGHWGLDGFTCKGSAVGTSGNHASKVVGVALGSIEQGQDPRFPAPWSQQVFSGVGTEAEAYYYRTGSQWSQREALRWAGIVDGSDVVNMSFGWNGDSDFCKQPSKGGLRSMAERATAAGALLVASAGNENESVPPGVCSVTPPATYADVLAVGALEDANSLDFADIADYSSRGLRSYTISDGFVADGHFIDLVAGGTISWMPMGGLGGYSDSKNGTSYAAPSVAGAAAVLKDLLYDFKFGEIRWRDPYVIRTLLAVMGDGFAPEKSASAVDGLSRVAGFGRLRFVDLTNPPGDDAWLVDTINVREGQEFAYRWASPLSGIYAPTGWKFAAIADKDGYGESPHIEFSLVDACSGGNNKVVRKTKRGALKWRMRMRENEMAAKFNDDWCMELRVNVKSGRGTLHLAIMEYDGDREYYDTQEP